MQKKKFILVGLALAVLMVILFVGYPAIDNYHQTRLRKIFGRQIAKNLTNYVAHRHTLPKEGEWDTLDSLGFDKHDVGTVPSYVVKSDSTYELVYFERFDGPYLTYQSVNGKWVFK